MNTPLHLLLAAVLTAAVAVAGQNQRATSMNVREAKFYAPEIVMLKTMPPQFELALGRDMPTPGWKFVVDAVDIDEAAGRITVRVTEHRPEGMVAQVITPSKLNVSLGTLAPGHYVLEIWSRRSTSAKHTPIQAFILDAHK